MRRLHTSEIMTKLLFLLLSLLPAMAASAQVNATVDASTTYVTGIYGQGFSHLYNGWVTIADFSGQLTNNYSVVINMKQAASPADVGIMWAAGGPSSADIPATWIGIQSNGTISATSYGGNTINGPLVTNNAPHQIMAYYTATTLTLYVDNVSVGSVASTGTQSGSEAIGSSLNRHYSVDNSLIVDEIAVFTGNRHAVETSLPTGPYTGSEPNLLHLYHADGNGLDSASSGGTTPPVGTISVVPNTFPLGVPTQFTITGTGTSWTSSTLPTVAGGAGAYISNMVANGQTLTGTLLPGTVTGSLTVGDTTDTATTTVTAAANVTTTLVGLGDSLMAGAYATSPGTIASPRFAALANYLGPQFALTNSGVNGQRIDEMQARIATDVDAYYVSGKTNIVLYEGGANNFAQSYTPAQIATADESVLSALHTAHPDRKIIVATMTPGANLPASPALYDTLRRQVNTTRRANLARWTTQYNVCAIADEGADQLIGQDGQEYNQNFYQGGDHLHMNNQGYDRVGSIDSGAVRACLNPNGGGGNARTGLTY